MPTLTSRDIDGLHVVQSGVGGTAPVLLLHGWPLDSTSYRGTMEALGADCHCIAVDLPGVGKSVAAFESGEKVAIAKQLAAVLDALELERVHVVGQDLGGMVAYAMMRTLPDRVTKACIIDTVIPGVDPWDEVLCNPHIWHFAFHAVPELPELLVEGHVDNYFDFFFDTLAGKGGVSPSERRACVEAYADRRALHAGFEFYRALERDAKENRRLAEKPCDVPLLYLRGGDGKTSPEAYVRGFQKAHLTQVRSALVEGAGHFVSNEQPRALAELIRG